jgi:hypothetical protein
MSGGDIPKMQGWTWLLPRPRPPYFENAPTLGLYPTLKEQCFQRRLFQLGKYFLNFHYYETKEPAGGWCQF